MEDHPEFWSDQAHSAFDAWVYANSRLVQRYGFPVPRRLVREVLAANINQATTEWGAGTVLLMDNDTDSGNSL